MTVRRLRFRSDGLLLHGELLLPEDARIVAVLCHGIPSGRPPDIDDPGYPGLGRELAARGFAAAWFDFRGTRDAPGDFSLEGWVRDLSEMLNAIASEPDAGELPRAVIGSSAGGAVAVAVAARRPDVLAVATLATPATFDVAGFGEPARVVQRLRNIGIIRDPAFPPDVDAWWREFETTAAEVNASRVSPRPLLVVHGDADETVPYPHAERIFLAAREPKELVRIPAGAHQLRRDPRAVDALADWLATVSP